MEFSLQLKIASDIHGAYDDLITLLCPEDTAILLGDFINIIDYSDFSGLLSQVVDRRTIEETLDLISRKKLKEAKQRMTRTASTIDGLYEKISALADECYSRLFGALPCRCYLINGNVDFPMLMKKNLSEPAVYIEEYGSFEWNERRVGLVSGHPHMTYSFGMPGEVRPEIYAARLEALGPVDHLFVHPPPAIRELSFDDKANRDEGGSIELLNYIERHQPRTVHFGHVHSPIAKEMTIGRTHAVNVGCFRDEKRLTTIEWQARACR
jgi:Icc-related predicted phosphoesterase